MTEESKPDLPMSGTDFLEYIKDRHPNQQQMSSSDIVNYVRVRYLKPNWPHWGNMAEVSLHQAVWLSLDIEPWKEMSDLNEAVRQTARVMERCGIYLMDALCEDYELRMTQCLSAIKAEALQARWGEPAEPDRSHDLSERWYISLERFRQWGESLRHPYVFPHEFPPTATAEPKIPAILSDEGALTPYASGLTWVDAEYDERLKEAMSLPPDDDEPDTKTRGTYLRTICALAVLAKLIDDNGDVATGAAGKVARRMQTLGFNNGPKERTIRDLLKEAASLKPGE